MRAYIEIVSAVMPMGLELRPFHLWLIGDFTRENISKWLDNAPTQDLGIYGWEDFHAVCGDVDIPWATEDGWRFFLPQYREK